MRQIGGSDALQIRDFPKMTSPIVGRPYYDYVAKRFGFWDGLQWSLAEDILTQVDADYYLDGDNGNDDNDGTTLEAAFKTIDRAIDQINHRVISSKVNLRMKGGTYETDLRVIRVETDGLGQLVFEGIDPPTYIAGPFTVTGVSEHIVDGITVGWDVTVSGAGWTVDEFAGKFIRYTDSGDMQDRIVGVHRNSTDTILHLATNTYSPDVPKVGSTFNVIESSTRIVFNHDGTTVFDLRSNCKRRGASFIFANIEFSNPVTDLTAFHFVNTGKIITGCTKFHSKAQYNCTVTMSGGGMNSATYQRWDRTQLVDQQLVISRAMFGIYYLNWPSLVLENNYGDVLNHANPTLKMCGPVNAAWGGQSEMAHFISRGWNEWIALGGDISSAIMERVEIDHRAHAGIFFSIIDGNGPQAIRVDDDSVLGMEDCIINRSGGYAFTVETNARVVVSVTNITSANIPSYHFIFGTGAQVTAVGACNFIGATNKVYFRQSNYAGATPTDTVPTAPGRIYDKNSGGDWLGSQMLTTSWG